MLSPEQFAASLSAPERVFAFVKVILCMDMQLHNGEVGNQESDKNSDAHDAR